MEITDYFTTWITVYTIVYIFIKKYIPYWMSPFPNVIFISICQAFIIIIGLLNNKSIYNYIIPIIGKLTILYIAFTFMKIDLSLKTLIFNIILFISYLIFTNNKKFDAYELYNDLTK